MDLDRDAAVAPMLSRVTKKHGGHPIFIVSGDGGGAPPA
jgi:hypothetical protein